MQKLVIKNIGAIKHIEFEKVQFLKYSVNF